MSLCNRMAQSAASPTRSRAWPAAEGDKERRGRQGEGPCAWAQEPEPDGEGRLWTPGVIEMFRFLTQQVELAASVRDAEVVRNVASVALQVMQRCARPACNLRTSDRCSSQTPPAPAARAAMAARRSG